MSIAILFDQKNPEPWVKLLEEKLPNTSVEVYPSIKEPEQVTFAVCWKPEKDALSQFPNLKVVQSIGAGVDHIFKSQQLSDSVQVCRIIDSQLTQDLYEYVLTGLMSYLRDFSKYFNDQLTRTWKPKRYQTIGQTTVTVLGLGSIGAFIAKELAEIGFNVRGWSKNPKKIAGVQTYKQDQLTVALQQSDVLVNVLPLTPDTEDILNSQTMSLLNPGGYMINVGRGAHLVENDLMELIESGQLSGALLDVFRTEPLPGQHPFWNHPKITITPHVASITTLTNAVDIVVENWNRHLHSKKLLHEVSVIQGY
ncbi:2-hydroxyacid dehydrogenase [Marinoscillum pacificum]|uniref:2-hydroxyacid dehydrogenase n=1 Tax=Marinoscillum pacificum TaxID=392723 RepID=UPI00215785C8|nr:glyoxylate/hydroxypyruvate reductase A [Marinoscillum pacificum]